MLHSRVAEKNASHDQLSAKASEADFIAIGSMILRLVITHNFHRIFVLLAFC